MSAGADGIPCTIVKDTATCFVTPLTRLIQSCIEYQLFRSLWKHSKVCPIHKADDPTLVTNYRPISVISVFAKVFEMYIYDQLLPYVSVTISNAQHGFFCRRSTVTNLISYTEYLNSNMKNGDQVNVFQTDFVQSY